jgi:hypothetical protein
MTAERFTDDDPPKKVDKPDATGSALFREPQAPGNAEMLEEATPLPLEDVADLAAQERHDLPAGETMGDAEGSGAGIDIGSGTEELKPIGGGKPPVSDEDVEPSGSYRPGESRD